MPTSNSQFLYEGHNLKTSDTITELLQEFYHKNFTVGSIFRGEMPYIEVLRV